MARLSEFFAVWEARGEWPVAIRHSIIALVPKEGGQHEKGLRPIGILSYIYRLWMALRRAVVKPWSLAIHGGSHMGAAECAFRTAVEVEHAGTQGRHALLAFLDCSKCYERVGHALAAERAARSGMPLRVLNMVMNIDSGPRLVRAHGAVALPVLGHHGLIAGCAFAKDVLKAFLKEAA